MRTLLIAFLLTLGVAAAKADDKRPVVVELFTSQGCNSCPPADAFLGELAARADVLALSLHVDYWDYIGWKDPFAQRVHTERQRSYAKALHQRFVYTPQMVIDGSLQGVGSESATINKLIEKARKMREAGPSVSLAGEGTQRVLHLGAAASGAPATVWLVGYDRKHETPIRAGENSGRHLANYNVVRFMQQVGTWTGAAASVPLDLQPVAAKCERAAVIVQTEDTGPIVAAMRVELPKR